MNDLVAVRKGMKIRDEEAALQAIRKYARYEDRIQMISMLKGLPPDDRKDLWHGLYPEDLVGVLRSRFKSDFSREYIAQMIYLLPSATSFDILDAIIKEPLKAPLPVLGYLHTELSARRSVVTAAFETMALPPARLALVVSSCLEAQFGDRQSKESLHHSWDSLFVDLLGLLAELGPHKLTMTWTRNTADTMSISTKRPDFLLWINKALLLKGEEKAVEKDIQVAELELTSKMTQTWCPGVFGECCFQIAYAAGGGLLRLFAIKTGQRAVLLEAFNLTTPSGRGDAIRATFNVYRVLASLVPMLPPLKWSVGMSDGLLDVEGNLLRRLTFMDDYVIKEIPDFVSRHSRYAEFSLLQLVYSATKNCPHLIQSIKPPHITKEGAYSVRLSPLGMPNDAPPTDEGLVKEAVLSTLRGLSTLHEKGFVHRDVRWSNLITISNRGNKEWILIDLEMAGRKGQKCVNDPYPLPHWQLSDGGNVLEVGGIYTERSDLRMMASRMLSGLGFTLSPEAKLFKIRLEDGTHQTAAQALSDPWLQ